MILCGVEAEPRETMERAGLAEELGRDRFVPTYKEALALGAQLVAQRGQAA